MFYDATLSWPGGVLEKKAPEITKYNSFQEIICINEGCGMEAHLTIIIIIIIMSIISIINGKQRSAIKIKENDTYYFLFLLLVNGVGQCWSLGNPHFSAKPSQS